MSQPSLSLLSLSIPKAMKVLGSLKTIDYDCMPDSMADGFIDLIEGLMNCFPAGQAEFHDLVYKNSRNMDFNHAAEAYRILSPAAKASFPLAAEHGTMLANTPLTVALTPLQGTNLLGTCLDAVERAPADEFEAAFQLTERLLEGYPSVRAAVDQGVDASLQFDYFREAYKGLVEAGAAKGEFGMAA